MIAENPVTMRDQLKQPENLSYIQQLVKLNPIIKVKALAKLVCEKFSFKSSNGKLQTSGCQVVLNDFTKQGKINLVNQVRKASNPQKFTPMLLSDTIYPLPINMPKSVHEIKDEIEIILIGENDNAEKLIWNDIISTEHPNGNKRLVGYIVKYLIKFQGFYIGAASFSSSAFNIESRDSWIGWSNEQKAQYRNKVVSMSRFLIRKKVRCENLASHLISKLIACIKVDFKARYEMETWLLESFVDTASHLGTCYKASNWQLIGQSKGRGRNDRGHKNEESIKELYVYVLEDNFRELGGLKPKEEEYPPMKIEENLSSSVWGKFEFGGSDLGDIRLTNRLVKIATHKCESPTSFYAQAAQGSEKDIEGYYNFLGNSSEKITPVTILAKHHKNTLCKMASFEQVIVAHDSSSLNFSGLIQTLGLGRIGKNDKSKSGTLGLQMHTSFAMTIDGLPIGILSSPCSDPKLKKNKKNVKKNRPIAETESIRWLEGYQRTIEISKKLKNTQIISTMDRECDIGEIYELAIENRKNAPVVIRVRHNRNLHDTEIKLYEAMEKAENVFTKRITVPPQRSRKKTSKKEARPYMPARETDLLISYTKVSLSPPKFSKKKQPIELYAVYARELEPPLGAEKIEWRLLTTLEVTNDATAIFSLKVYGNRWGIEELFRVAKTTCSIECQKLGDAYKIERIVAITLVLACRIMLMTFLARAKPNMPADQIFTEAEILGMNLIKIKKTNIANKEITKLSISK